MRGGSAVVVVIAGVVAAAAIVSGVRGVLNDDDGDPDAPAAPSGPTTPTDEAPASTAVPIGDLRRLPPPAAGDWSGRLMVFARPDCTPRQLDLATLAATDLAGPAPACTVWPSPGAQALASTQDEPVLVARPADGAAVLSGIDYAPGAHGALTIADDGGVAACDGTRVRYARLGAARTVRSFTPVEGIFDERCITGAVGRRVVRLGGDRRSLVAVPGGQVVRRLAEAVERPVVAITSSPDGYVIVVDTADGTPRAVVFDPDGAVTVPRVAMGTGVRIRKILLSHGGGAVAILTSRSWEITNLATGLTLATPGGTRVTDVAFSPAGDALAAATDAGLLLADAPSLAPRALLPDPVQAVVWLPEG